jgi:hypothetical protein
LPNPSVRIHGRASEDQHWENSSILPAAKERRLRSQVKAEWAMVYIAHSRSKIQRQALVRPRPARTFALPRAKHAMWMGRAENVSIVVVCGVYLERGESGGYLLERLIVKFGDDGFAGNVTGF